MIDLLVVLAIFALVAAALARWFAGRMQARSGLPVGARVVFSDTGAWQNVPKPLFSRRYQLTGKPDYIVESNGVFIPVEVKPNRRALEPLPWDVMQLAAYGLLVEEEYGVRPPYGLLKYRDLLLEVQFTDDLREELLQVLELMRADLESADVARSHEEPSRCRACGYRGACGQALEE